MDCHDRVQTKIKHLNGTGHVGSKLTGEIFSLNNASSLWWVRCGKKIAASILSEVYGPNVTMQLLNKP